MRTQHPSLVLRRDAAQATHDRYVGRLHRWGTVDCCRILAFHLRKLSYRPNLARFGTYTSELGAYRAVRKAGFKDIEAVLKSLGLPTIGHASALVGDVFGLESGGEWPALAVYLGNGRVLTSSEDHPHYGVTTPADELILKCWRVDPCPTR